MAALGSSLVVLSAITTYGANGKSPTPSKTASAGKLENFHDLIAKAQNLTLQRDRLQTSQVLIRGIQKETRGSAAFKELVKTLDELSAVFYTEKAQSLFSSGEAQILTKPREAIEQLQEALRLEDGNVAILKALARTHLTLGECAPADTAVRSAEAIHPYSGEVHLLRLQILDCQKNLDLLSAKFSTPDPDLESVETFARGLQIKDLLRKKDTKKARALVSTWETQAPEYPEVYYWKWEVSRSLGSPDRAAAIKYSQLCQNLTPRRRKSYILDVDLCKGKETVDAYLKQSGYTISAPTGETPNE